MMISGSHALSHLVSALINGIVQIFHFLCVPYIDRCVCMQIYTIYEWVFGGAGTRARFVKTTDEFVLRFCNWSIQWQYVSLSLNSSIYVCKWFVGSNVMSFQSIFQMWLDRTARCQRMSCKRCDTKCLLSQSELVFVTIQILNFSLRFKLSIWHCQNWQTSNISDLRSVAGGDSNM